MVMGAITSSIDSSSATTNNNRNSTTAIASSREQQQEEKAGPKKKICCACPDTKILRDECVVEHGPDACKKWIDAHLRCLRAEGFNV
ncbi:hypothetical protein O6H91_22G006200 [Diphasiastrum complanatum]|uniref:Uncharacterized protein n=1 Tax=Diphasiastrum complanatum TaxID=34168 RepID=A0ACC2ACP1_DIPCM|nr:hypothetical protein O6H91_22G006200 [Diphasiastrum complanatum]